MCLLRSVANFRRRKQRWSKLDSGGTWTSLELPLWKKLIDNRAGIDMAVDVQPGTPGRTAGSKESWGESAS